MVKKQQSKRQQSIRSKLMAAVCMLLVSAIMMVSSTYAWFTLSTAPEVTGITTAVGANGNLEMALLPTSGSVDDITSAAGDSMSATNKVAANVTWGNLVDLDDTSYGLEAIKLYPSELNLSDGKVNTTGAILKTPTYGSDGRVVSLAENAYTGAYDSAKSAFITPTGTFYGVRGVGVASGMTERQLSYRNSRSSASTYMSKAQNTAINTLTTNGATLANMAIKHGLNSGTADDVYTWEDVTALSAMVTGLETTLGHIENAYMQYILAIAASNASGSADTVWTAVKAEVEAANATLSSVLTKLNEYEDSFGAEFPMPEVLTTGVEAFNEAKSAVETAKSKLPAITENKTDYAWADVSNTLHALMDADKMTVNDLTVAQIKANEQLLVDSYLEQNKLVLTIAPDGGVFADVADQCGNYTASIKISVVYNGLKLDNVTATMKTATNQSSTYLSALSEEATRAGEPAGTSDEALPFSEMYGYIIDLAFRTNAANSNLLLQQTGVDRIYQDQTGNADTMGHGATMTFASSVDGFGDDGVKGLMSAIRLVFFDPHEGTIYAYGKLDVNQATLGADGWTAEIYLYEITAGTTTTEYVVDNENGTYGLVDNEYKPLTELTDYEGDKYAEKTTTTPAGETVKTDDVIMALNQNQATKLSVLVYLDGNHVSNEDVAAAAESMSGTMNLQFSSSATLVPMDYAALHNAGTTPTTPDTPAEGG